MWRFIRNLVEAVVDAVTEAVEAVVTWFADLVLTALEFAWNLAQFVFFAVTLQFERAGRALLDAARSFWEFIESVLFGFVGLVIQLGAIFISGIQQIFGFERSRRGLTEAELAYLQPIFRDSVDYRRVEIRDGNVGVFGTGAVTTIGNVIRVGASSTMNNLEDPRNQGVVVHEMVHVWQYQNGGPRYIPFALFAQWFGNTSGDWVSYPANRPPLPLQDIVTAPRGYGFESTLDSGGQWDGLNVEQQATFIDAAFSMGVDFSDPANMSFVFPNNYNDYSAQLVTAVSMIQARQGVAIWPPFTLPLTP